MALPALLQEVRSCRECAASLPLGPRPLLSASKSSRVLLIGQAPGRKAHEAGVPWRDPSGDRLRLWLGVSGEEFYDERLFALVPMGFCYPGTTSGGDMAPRAECAPLWHERLLGEMHEVRVTVLIGRHAQLAKLGDACQRTLTDTVAAWRDHGPDVFPLPHPSPRNNRWLRNNPWFEEQLVPRLQSAVREALA